MLVNIDFMLNKIKHEGKNRLFNIFHNFPHTSIILCKFYAVLCCLMLFFFLCFRVNLIPDLEFILMLLDDDADAAKRHNSPHSPPPLPLLCQVPFFPPNLMASNKHKYNKQQRVGKWRENQFSGEFSFYMLFFCSSQHKVPGTWWLTWFFFLLCFYAFLCFVLQFRENGGKCVFVDLSQSPPPTLLCRQSRA